MADAEEGPKTQRSYNVAKVPDGSRLVGTVVDIMGRPVGADAQPSMHLEWPLFRPHLDIQSSEDVHESLYTGVKVLMRLLSGTS